MISLYVDVVEILLYEKEKIQFNIAKGGVVRIKRRLVQVSIASCETSKLIHGELHLSKCTQELNKQINKKIKH